MLIFSCICNLNDSGASIDDIHMIDTLKLIDIVLKRPFTYRRAVIASQVLVAFSQQVLNIVPLRLVSKTPIQREVAYLFLLYYGHNCDFLRMTWMRFSICSNGCKVPVSTFAMSLCFAILLPGSMVHKYLLYKYAYKVTKKNAHLQILTKKNCILLHF